MDIKCKKFDKFKVHYRQTSDFEWIWKELFEDGDYYFESTKESPFIIDGGSHIGLSILYFKSKYPKARIIAFEPNPDNLELLKLNLSMNEIDNVRVIPKALSDKEDSVEMFGETTGQNPSTMSSTLVHNLWGDADEQKSFIVETTRLINFIDNEVDFLKLDIEGCEEQVLRDIEPKLFMVNQIELEYHGTRTNQEVNDLDRIIDLLERHSYQVDVAEKDLKALCREQTIRRVNPKFAQVKGIKIK